MKKIKSSKLKIGKVISKRITSCVMAGVLNNDRVVIKIEHISKKDFEDKNSNMWKEIEFSKKFGNKYPNQFMQLKDYYFENGCTGIQLDGRIKNPPKCWDKKLLAEYQELVDENLCIYKIYDQMDSILAELLPKLSIPQIYSALIQVHYAISLLHKNGYIHGDLHRGNVGAMKTDKNAHILLGNVSIPTHGYQYKLIDFGLTIHKSDVKTADDKKRFAKQTNIRYDDGLFSDIFIEIKHECSLGFAEIMLKLKKRAEFKLVQLISSNPTVEYMLFQTLYPDAFTSISNGKIIYKSLLPIEDLLFMAYNGIQSTETFNYLLEKLATS